MVTRMMTIGSDSIISYLYCPKKNSKRGVSPKSKENLKKAYSSGSLSSGSAKKIKKILNNWLLAIYCSQRVDNRKRNRKRRYMVMITLTLPSTQVESDNEIKRKYLNNFLIQLRKRHSSILYLWVAEKQKNGNIHFHLMVDRYVKKDWVTRVWNKVLENGDYINNFEKKYKHRNPPTTQTQGQKKMGSAASYLTKYVTKGETSINLEGHKWACSSELLLIIKSSFIQKYWYHDYLEHYREQQGVKYFENDFVKIYYFDRGFLENFINHDIFFDNENHFLALYSKIYPELLGEIKITKKETKKEYDRARQMEINFEADKSRF